jgi:hypothetical protein
LYSSPNITRQIKSRRRWEGHVAGMGEEINMYRLMVRKPEGKRPLGWSRNRWDHGIRMNVREIEWRSRVDSVGSG